MFKQIEEDYNPLDEILTEEPVEPVHTFNYPFQYNWYNHKEVPDDDID